MPRPILKQKAADSSIDTQSRSISGTPALKETPHSDRSGLAPQAQTENSKPIKEISDELSNWFLWGNGGIYDQFFEYIFPKIEESAKQQIAEENSYREAGSFSTLVRYAHRVLTYSFQTTSAGKDLCCDIFIGGKR
jgi:hypothetical protein